MGTKEGRVRKPSAKAAGKKAAKPGKTSYDVERDKDGRGYFYFRSEPLTRLVRGVDVRFSYDDLVAEPESTDHWDGVRNHVAKNWMRAMRVGDQGLFYHSNAGDGTGVVGIVEIVKEAYPDHTAFDKNDPHFDGRSKEDSPTWFMVNVKAIRKLENPVLRPTLKEDSVLSEMYMMKNGRVSVGPVMPSEWDRLVSMGDGEFKADE